VGEYTVENCINFFFFLLVLLLSFFFQDNINPIEKVENSSLIVAATVHQTAPLSLIAPEHQERIAASSSRLFRDEKKMIGM
jgi:hypothetical protein